MEEIQRKGYIVVTRDGHQEKRPIDFFRDLPENASPLMMSLANRVQYCMIEEIAEICEEGPFDDLQLIVHVFSSMEETLGFVEEGRGMFSLMTTRRSPITLGTPST